MLRMGGGAGEGICDHRIARADIVNVLVSVNLYDLYEYVMYSVTGVVHRWVPHKVVMTNCTKKKSRYLLSVSESC